MRAFKRLILSGLAVAILTLFCGWASQSRASESDSPAKPAGGGESSAAAVAGKGGSPCFVVLNDRQAKAF